MPETRERKCASMKAITAKDVVDLLNELFALDPKAISALFCARFACNKTIAEHPTVIVKNEADGCSLGMLGIINGLLLERVGGPGPVGRMLKEGSEETTGFALTEEFVSEDNEGHRQLTEERDELLAALKKYVERSQRNRAVSSSDDPRIGGRSLPDALESKASAILARIEDGKHK